MRVKVKLGDLKPNPFKKEIEGGYIDPTVVARIRENIKQSGVWGERITGRYNDKGQIEIAFGHHQLEAMIQELGKNAEVYIHVVELSDDLMFKRLANENNFRELSNKARCDTVALARLRLEKDPSRCKVIPSVTDGMTSKQKSGQTRHEHGSASCISDYLGTVNWAVTTVRELLLTVDRLDESITPSVADRPRNEHGTNTRGRIGQQTAVALTQLDKPSQKEAFAALKTAPVEVTTKAIREAVERTTEEAVALVLPQQKDAAKKATVDLELPSSTVNQIVVAVNDAASTDSKKTEAVSVVLQKAGVSKKEIKKYAHAIASAVQKPVEEARPEIARREFQRIADEALEAERLRKLKNGSAEAQKIIGQLVRLPDDEAMQTIIRCRDLISPDIIRALITTLGETVQRFTKYADELSKPTKLLK